MTDPVSERFDRWFCGDQYAASFARQLWSAIQIWDDIEDEGQHPDHNALCSWLAFGKERDPFFRAHADLMRPAFLIVYLSWTAANVMERGDENDVAKAYMLRAAYYQLLHVMAYACGGDMHAVAVGPEIYRFYGETLDDLQKEFGHA